MTTGGAQLALQLWLGLPSLTSLPQGVLVLPHQRPFFCVHHPHNGWVLRPRIQTRNCYNWGGEEMREE